MLGIITNLFKKENSKDDAKNRLKLVLIQDRAMLPSGVLENMKDDILKVLSKYVEIEKSIPKELNFKLMEELKNIELTAPVKRGDIVIKNVFNTGVDVVVTKDM